MAQESQIDCPLREAAGNNPGRIAIVSPERTLTYGEWDELAAHIATRLQKEPLERGTRVGLLAPRGWRLLVLMLACWRAELVVVPVSTRLPERVLAEALSTACAEVLLTDRALELPSEDISVRSIDKLFSTLDRADRSKRDVFWALDDPASIVFTSGSTGRPKAALHSFRNHVRNAEGANLNMPLSPGDRWLLALPLYHVGGLGVVMRCLLARAAVVIPERSGLLGDLISQHRITHVSVVPTQVRRLVDDERRGELASLKAMLIGGAPLPVPLLERAHGRGWPLFTTYGLTEMTSQVTATPPGASLDMLCSSGDVLMYREVKIANDGEILVRGETLFQGYVEGDVLDPARDGDGWFHTRDIGRFNTEGGLHVTGRLDHQFVSGGENIQPEMIEAALCRREGVVRAVVVPVADEEYGQRPVAFIEVEPGAPDPDGLREALREELPRFMIPDAFYVWPGEFDAMKVPRAILIKEAERLRATSTMS